MLAPALTTTTIGLLAAGGGLTLMLIVLSFVTLRKRRSRPATEGRIASVVADLNTRMNSMMRELGQALEDAEEESRRLRLLSNLVGSIELEEVLERTLEAAGGIPGTDASLVCLRRTTDGKPLVASLGLAPGEAELEGFIAGPPDGRRARSIGLSYRYDASLVEEEGAIRSGFAVPLSVDGELFGHVAVFTRSSEATFDDEELTELEELALRAGPAIENARRYEEAQQLADLDALTGLHNRRYFHATLMREVARAHRYGRQLALIVLDLDEFKAINDRLGHLGGDAVLAAAAERMQEVVRSADITCRIGGDEFAVIMPESSLAEADHLSRRFEAAFSSRPVAQIAGLRFSAGIAELHSDDDAVALFQRADDALYSAKGNGKRQITAAPTPTPFSHQNGFETPSGANEL